MDGAGIVIGWLTGYAVVYGAVLVWAWRRHRHDRAAVRRCPPGRYGAVAAAGGAAGDAYADLVGLRLLHASGVVTVSDAGVVRAVPGAPGPSDPLLGALTDGVRRRDAEGTLLYQVRRADGFRDYRLLLRRATPSLYGEAERYRVITVGAAILASGGLMYHGLFADAPVPLLGDDVGWWFLTAPPLFGLLLLLAHAWPRWRTPTRTATAHTAECRALADAAVADLPSGPRTALLKHAEDPDSPRAARHRAPDAHGDGHSGRGGRPGSDGDGWADGDSSHGCGGCGDSG
ncbi:hypothetical protein [Streptomyces sp. NPDC059247]|uniref:hypothetical protein n=1 Tax=Streptomyces sp. NPDC059247 TaxID=3346790 RepID=UPI0036BF9EFE